MKYLRVSIEGFTCTRVDTSGGNSLGGVTAVPGWIIEPESGNPTPRGLIPELLLRTLVALVDQVDR